MKNLYKTKLKMILDVSLSFVGISMLFPIMMIIAILVRIFLGSPIIFKQRRPGLHGEIFTIYKFRTMKNLYARNGELLSDDKRLTAFGKLLRKLSLDELPELFNVIKGDMSLVGPRPLLVDYLEIYNAHQSKRHDVRPGITGLVQISGRNNLTWNEKFNLDAEYVNHVSFFLDMRILAVTLIKVFRCVDINQPGQATMEKFQG